MSLQRLRARLFVSAALCLAVPAVAPAQQVPPRVLEAEQQRIAVIARAQRASISLFASTGQGGGSGVVITPDGYALTNFHVSRPAGDYMKCSMPDGKLYDAVIVGIDPTGDVALIKLLGRDDFPHATMGDSDSVRVGDWCFAVGNPFLLATDFQPSISYGIISGIHRYQYPAGTLLEYADCLQTDAAINPGNSGGPLFDAQGQLIGVNGRGSFEKRGRVNVGVGYAISINQIRQFMGDLRSGRIVDHATLGATVSTDEDGRVVVTNILESSDAYRRGLRYNHEIVAFGGRTITSANDFKNVLGIFPKGWRVPLSYRDETGRHDVLVRLAGVHATDELVELLQRPQVPIEPPQPKPKDPDPPPGERPAKRPQLPLPKSHQASKAEVPQHIEPYIKTRSGYANYYFNELNRDRVWNGLLRHGDFQPLRGEWKVRGKEGEFILGEQRVLGIFSNGPLVEVDLGNDLGEQCDPPASKGLLIALHLWQRLLTLGPTKYGEVYYLGTAPIPTQKDLVDVLVATHQVVETRFMFDPATGHLVGLEMLPDLDVDPCEIYFSQYREVGGRMLPHRLELRFGDDLSTVIQLQQFEFPAAAEAGENEA